MRDLNLLNQAWPNAVFGLRPRLFFLLMQALGVDIQTIQSIVGHADTEMTEHYLHVQESIRQSAIQLFSEAFSA